MAVVNAKDIAKPEDLEDASATCWIKMSEVSIEGLRQAFLDPDSRIRLNTDPEPEEHAELLALSWEGGFLDGGRHPVQLESERYGGRPRRREVHGHRESQARVGQRGRRRGCSKGAYGNGAPGAPQALRELQQAAVDGEEFIRLRREIEGLRPLRERQALLARLEKEHTGRRRTLLTEWEEVKARGVPVAGQGGESRRGKTP